MTNLLALLRMIVALARAMGISPIELANRYAETEECQEFYDLFVRLEESPSEEK